MDLPKENGQTVLEGKLTDHSSLRLFALFSRRRLLSFRFQDYDRQRLPNQIFPGDPLDVLVRDLTDCFDVFFGKLVVTGVGLVNGLGIRDTGGLLEAENML